MASLSAIEYEERRNKDKSLFSRMLKVTVALEAGEAKVDLAQAIPKLIGLEVDHVIMFVSDKLNEDPCPSFVTADKITPPEPKIVLPPTNQKAIEDLVKNSNPPSAAETPKEPEVPSVPATAPIARKVPRIDPSRIDPKDPRPAGFPCIGCVDDKRCPDPCEEWNAFQKGLNISTAPSAKEAYEASHPKGPAVPATPKAQAAPPAEKQEESSPAPTSGNKLKIVRCTVCNGDCQKKPSTKYPGHHFNFCPKCKANRQNDGTPFPPRKV